MCLIVFAWQLDAARPLVVAANRDEFHARPARPFGAWPDLPNIHAGRDLEAGGTWMGIGSGGRFAALTNIRDPLQPVGTRSRGELASAYLAGARSPDAYLEGVASRLDDYSGFNLLVGDRESLWHLNAQTGTPHKLAPGVYGVSNADLDTPWPKLARSKSAFKDAWRMESTDALFALLADRTVPPDEALPKTGVSLQLERLVGSTFIVSPDYGTRVSTVVERHADGTCHVEERRFDREGKTAGIVTWVGR
ncbi:NRDE family protein [Pseudomonas sp. Marseille-QA0892]